MRPKRLALGAAIGTPAVAISALATGCDGILTPTSGRAAVTISGMSSAFSSKRVSGPGQNAEMIAVAEDVRVEAPELRTRESISRSETWTIRGSQEGRSFASKIFFTDSLSSALAPRP